MTGIYGIVGKKRHGKTTLLADFALDAYARGKIVYTNEGFDLNFPNIKWDYHNLFELRHCFLAIDEIHNIMDSRTPAALANRLMSYFIAQSGKFDVTIVYTTIANTLIDLRMRYEADLIIEANALFDDQRQPVGYLYNVFNQDEQLVYRFPMAIDYARKIQALFNSYQAVNPTEIGKVRKRHLDNEALAK